METTKHPNTHEIQDLLKNLIVAGFNLVAIFDGEDRIDSSDIKKIKEHILSVDESALYVKHPNYPRNLTLSIVLGNSKGEAVNDYTDLPELHKVVTAHYDKWSD